MIERSRKLVESNVFVGIVLAMILISAALVGLETYSEYAPGTPAGDQVQLIQNLILGFFILEIVLRIVASGPRYWTYFLDPWNVFDFVIVAVCLIPDQPNYLLVLRLGRILRTLRMISIMPALQRLVIGLLRSVPSLGYVGVLLFLHFYVYAVIGTVLFRANDPLRFGDLSTSMLTLFQVLTLEGWNDIFHTQYFGSDVTYDDAWRQLAGAARVSSAMPIAAAMYFISFIMLGTMIMLNLFTGVIVTSMEEARAEQVEQAKARRAAKLAAANPGAPPPLTMEEQVAQINARLEQLIARIAPDSLPTPASSVPSEPDSATVTSGA
jgi:voltage-gated sodium channel